MGVTEGARLGQYDIRSLLGEGGMGKVYRATDTNLGREVAVKVLPEAFAQDPDRVARFEREARTLAALNHPNIAAIYGFERTDGVNALIMELVEGSTLADRIARGPLSLRETLSIARQIAEALETAHEQGVIHRDLKPANIKVRDDGTVKVLDFGLAKLVDTHSRTTQIDATQSPTLTVAAMSGIGMILGTAAYMSPEQAAGKPADKRADIWSFAVVVWEMLTGKPLFAGESVSHTLADVLRADIDFGRLPPATPRQIRQLLRRCLDRDPRQRLRDIGEARVVIDAEGRGSNVEPPTTDYRRRTIRLLMTTVAVLATLCAGLMYVAWRAIERPAPVVRLTAPFPESAAIDPGSLPALSPDGRRVAYSVVVSGQRMLWLRDLDSATARSLAGTDDAIMPFWSPDSRSIGFFARGTLKRLDLDSGSVRTLCNAPSGRGGTWNADGVILFAPTLQSGLSRVPSDGGDPVTVTTVAATEVGHRHPSFLPDGRHFLYLAKGAGQQKSAVYVASIDSTVRIPIAGVTSNAVYSPVGYLFFVREQTLIAQRFDVNSFALVRDPFPVAQGVDYFPGEDQGMFAVSRGQADPAVFVHTSGWRSGAFRLTWLDRTGKVTGTVGAPAAIVRSPRVSSTGEAVAFERLDERTGLFEVWTHDVKRGADTPLTSNGGNNSSPVWSPHADYVAFSGSERPGSIPAVFRKSTAGVAPEELLHKGDRPTRPTDWTRDGRYIIATVENRADERDIWILPMSGERKPYPFVNTAFDEHNARVSADNRWIAYVSNEGRREEVWVETFPTRTARRQVSNGGGTRPVWNGRDLYFIAADRTLTVARMLPGGSFAPPQTLFNVLGAAFDVVDDGRILTSNSTDQRVDPMSVVLNWPTLLKR